MKAKKKMNALEFIDYVKVELAHGRKAEFDSIEDVRQAVKEIDDLIAKSKSRLVVRRLAPSYRVRGDCRDCGRMIPGRECEHLDEYLEQDEYGTGACPHFTESEVVRYENENFCPTCGANVDYNNSLQFYCDKCGQLLTTVGVKKK